MYCIGFYIKRFMCTDIFTIKFLFTFFVDGHMTIMTLTSRFHPDLFITTRTESGNSEGFIIEEMIRWSS